MVFRKLARRAHVEYVRSVRPGASGPAARCLCLSLPLREGR